MLASMAPTDPFLSLAEQSPYFIGICDNEMVPFFVNAAGRRQVGIDADADVSKLLVRDFFYPEDQEFMLTDFFERVMKEGKAEQEVRFRNFKTGEAIWMLYSVFMVYGESGERIGFATVSRDISTEIAQRQALRASEETFRKFADVAPQFIGIRDASGRLEYVNERLKTFSGFDVEQLRDHTNAYTIVHPEDRVVLEQVWADALKSGEGWEMEVRMRGADGIYRWFLSRTVPLRDADGKVVRWFATSTDINAQKEAARALSEVDHRKDAFLATLSHELRTPLTSGYGWAKLLARSDDPELRASGMHAIEQSFASQIRLIDDLLDVSRIIAGKMQFEMETMDVAAAVDDAIETVRRVAEGRQVRIETEVARGLLISGDAARLTQVIWNLLSNAIKFSSANGVLRVKLRRQGPNAEIVVEDDGQGIDPEFLPYVFDRFRQADASANRRHGGLGLGLSIVASLVESHGGTVRAQSEGIGKGARFIVSLPLLERTEMPSPRYVSAANEELVDGAKVLVLDDDDGARLLMKTILTRAGAEVRAFATVAEALVALTDWTPDVMLSDLSMPIDDGFSFVRNLRASGNEVPAIAVTAYLRSEDAAEAAGFQAHLPKPFAPADLIAKIKAIRASRQRAGL
jgi:PAS domain S-box-containing protein